MFRNTFRPFHCSKPRGDRATPRSRIAALTHRPFVLRPRQTVKPPLPRNFLSKSIADYGSEDRLCEEIPFVRVGSFERGSLDGARLRNKRPCRNKARFVAIAIEALSTNTKKIGFCDASNDDDRIIAGSDVGGRRTLVGRFDLGRHQHRQRLCRAASGKPRHRCRRRDRQRGKPRDGILPMKLRLDSNAATRGLRPGGRSRFPPLVWNSTTSWATGALGR